ncbi:polysaccharide biosynthesis protein [Haloechinothrix sp. YIM 98757]|uniref:Polysaccharide biosynthesis protein n=1 Tax=Haloechinothrix aidingensis TaxID=2752311 RepID=A0A838AFP6_9PSEU|nr:polysaccharide biosynthesis protein [Haloechinothrix aidingensis]MBA0128083.1 polysaccharide biosynthesis protein [Haloechinothrix aidingensis]
MTRADAATRGSGRSAQLDTVIVAIAFGISNLGAYLLNVIAPRLLTPPEWGEFGALLAIVVVGAVAALGVQTVAALRVAALRAERQAAGGLDRSDTGPLVSLALTTAAVVTGVVVLATPVLVTLLHFGSPWPTLCVAFALALITCNGLFLGILQGSQRFGALARLIAIDGLGRTGSALIGLLLFRTPAGALAMMVVGTLLVVLTGWLMCGRPLPARHDRSDLGEVFHTAQALLGLVLLVNLDLMLARHHLSEAGSGEYAVGWVMTRLAYWLPYAIAVVALPKLADAEQRRRVIPIALGLCAAINGMVLLGSVLFGPTIVGLLGGQGYADGGIPIWAFALVGSLLSLVQILLYSRIASGDRRSTLLVWIAVLAEVSVVGFWLHGTLLEIVSAAVLTTAALVGASALIELRLARAARGTARQRTRHRS